MTNVKGINNLSVWDISKRNYNDTIWKYIKII